VKIGTPKEVMEGEARVAMTPQSARDLAKLGHACLIEAGAGAKAGFTDAAYEEAGVTVVPDAEALWSAAEVVAKVRPPTDDEVTRTREGQLLISFFWPAQNEDHMKRSPRRAVPSSRWTWCPVSRARRRWTRSRPWPTSRATAR